MFYIAQMCPLYQDVLISRYVYPAAEELHCKVGQGNFGREAIPVIYIYIVTMQSICYREFRLASEGVRLI